MPLRDTLTWSAQARTLEEMCKAPRMIIRVLLDHNAYPFHARIRWAAAICLMWGDPLRAYELLDEAEDDSEETRRPGYQFYLSQAASRVLHEEADSIWSYAQSICEAAVEDPATSHEDLFYSALHLLEGPPLRPCAPPKDVDDDSTRRALRALERVLVEDRDAQHALCLMACCLKRLGRDDDFLRCAKAAFELEGKLACCGRGLLGVEPTLEVALEWHALSGQLVHAAHYSLIASARHLLLASVEEHISELGPVAGFLDVRDRLARHVPALLTVSMELELWLREEQERQAAHAARLIEGEHPIDTARLAQAYAAKRQVGQVSIETWLGEQAECDAFPHRFELLCRYAFLRGYVTAQQALMLKLYDVYRAQASRPKTNGRLRKGFVALSFGMIGQWISGPKLNLQPLPAVVAAGLVAAAACLFDGERSGARMSYKDFRRHFYRWGASERDLLGALEFEAKYGLTDWLRGAQEHDEA